MNFLNEVASRYPAAISFAAGRPPDGLLGTSQARHWLELFVVERAREQNCDPALIWTRLGQYSDTNGIINDLVARYLACSEGIHVDGQAIMITNGFQEALLTVLLGVLDRERDAILTFDPTYVGLLGGAPLAGVPLVPVATDQPMAAALTAAVSACRALGRRARALYVIPDYDNPTGRVLQLAEREALLSCAAACELLVLEDCAYRGFVYEGDSLPSLKALDRTGHVIQLGSFSKLFMPGVRVGYLIADQPLGPHGQLLAQELSKIKSFVSVATSPLNQAVVGGWLMEQQFDVSAWRALKVATCSPRRQAMLSALDASFGQDSPAAPNAKRVGDVSWTRPMGGLFLTLRLPFAFEEAEVLECAREFQVLVCPMSFFSVAARLSTQIRLTFANVDEASIRSGIERLHAYVRQKRARRAPTGT